MEAGYEVIDHDTGELVPYTPPTPANLFGVANPGEIIEHAREHAKALDDVIRQRQLFKRIGSHDHLLVEAWTLLGSMLGVFPVVVWTKPLEDGNGFEARVEARTLAGGVVGAAEAMCSREENTWKSRDPYALKSMAQTRATSKALRGPLGFIVQLAGYNPTPADEMPDQPDSAAASTADGAAPVPPADPPVPPEPSGSQFTPPPGVDTDFITDAQLRKLWATWRETGYPDEHLRTLIREVAGVESTKQIPKAKFQAVLDRIKADDGIPF